jgi:arylamine N-acetyltransferase
MRGSEGWDDDMVALFLCQRWQIAHFQIRIWTDGALKIQHQLKEYKYVYQLENSTVYAHNFHLICPPVYLYYARQTDRGTQLETDLISPRRHADGVGAFMDFYDLTCKKHSLHSLRAILESFAHIPYENISKIIKLSQNWGSEASRIRLPEEVIESHIQKGLGGTCFSLTFFLEAILSKYGFQCYPVMADMRAGRNIHCCLIVILDGVKYLVDPGYLLTQPMEIHPSKPKLFRNEFSGVELRYDLTTSCYNLSTFDKDQTKWRYRFQDQPIPLDEFLQHWLASFGWNSMHGICLTKVMKDGMVYVHKNFMRETTFTGKRNFNIKNNYHATIHSTFGIDQEIVEQARVALDQNLSREQELGLWVPKKSPIGGSEIHEAH